MAHEAEYGARALLVALCGPPLDTPPWLKRPGRVECGGRWGLVRSLYRVLTDGELPDEMPRRETRRVDGVFRYQGRPFVFELDETQHFNVFRAETLRLYPDDLGLGFDRGAWIDRSAAKKKLEGGGWARPKPPLFPGDGGRHRQRAFRDALADIVPVEHGFLPTLRLDDRNVLGWMHAPDAEDRLRRVLRERLEGIDARAGAR